MRVSPHIPDPRTRLFRVGDEFTPWYHRAQELAADESEITAVAFEL